MWKAWRRMSEKERDIDNLEERKEDKTGGWMMKYTFSVVEKEER